jgi:hypothetical protein
VDTVGENVDQTHQHVAQRLLTGKLHMHLPMLARSSRSNFCLIVVVPVPQITSTILDLIVQEQQRSSDSYKIMVFFSTAMQTAYMARLAGAMGKLILRMMTVVGSKAN